MSSDEELARMLQEQMWQEMQPTSGPLRHINSEGEWDALLQRTMGKLIVVDFHATWCGPCHAIAPVYEELAGANPDVIFAKVDVDAVKAVAQKCGISAMPTFQFYLDGNKVGEMRGADPDGLARNVAKYKAMAPAADASAAAPAASDPLTGGSRYVPGGGSTGTTGASGRSGSGSGSGSGSKLFPQTQFLTTRTGNFAKMSEKLVQFAGEAADGDAPVDDAGLEALVAAVAEMGSDEDDDVGLSEAAVGALRVMLESWAPSKAFPAIDTVRLAVLRPASAAAIAREAGDDGSLLALALSKGFADGAGKASLRLGSRLLSNAFSEPETRAYMTAHAGECMDMAAPVIDATRDRPTLMALTSALVNYAVSIDDCPPDTHIQIVAQAAQLLLNDGLEPEPATRAMTAIGTLIHTKGNEARMLAVTLDIGARVAAFQSSDDSRAASAAAELLDLLNG